MTTYTYTVSCTTGQSQATGSYSPAPLKNKKGSASKFARNDIINFSYQLDGRSATPASSTMTMTIVQQTPAPTPTQPGTPFGVPSPINLLSVGNSVTITCDAPTIGVYLWDWVLSVTINGVTYTLDPEDQVGSGG